MLKYTQAALLTGNIVVDDPAMSLAKIAAAQSIRLGSCVQSNANLAKPGPGGVGALGGFIKDIADLYLPAIAMLPQHI